MKKLIVTGGGTGGHVVAGIAIAHQWKKEFGNEGEVLFVGAQGGIEERMVPKEKIDLRLIRLGSLNRVTLTTKLKTLFLIPFAFLSAIRILLSFRPDAVIGVGGYASGPVLFVAGTLGRLFGIRTSFLEQNAAPGLTNRILSRVVQQVFTCFPGMDALFSKNQVTMTGNPVRSQLSLLDSASRDPFTLFIFGGSQGAVGINSLVIEMLPYLKDYWPNLKVIHQTGERDFDRVQSFYQTVQIDSRVEKFIYDMESAYRASSLVICRSGSSTLSELASVGRAAMLIPFPYAADNHQEKNARAFEVEGAAEVVLQSETEGKQLASRVEEYIKHPDKITTMETRVRSFSRPDAAQDVVKALL